MSISPLLLFGAAGAAAGTTARLLLARLRRGAVVRVGWCEAATAVLWALTGHQLATGALPWWWLPPVLTVTWLAVPLTATDLLHRRLPDALTLPGFIAVATAIGLAAAFGGGLPLAAAAAAGGALLLVLHAGAHLVNPASLGAGDVKLSATIGSVLGAVGWTAVLAGMVLAALVTLTVGALWRRGRHAIPHGPGLLAATCVFALCPGVGPAGGVP